MSTLNEISQMVVTGQVRTIKAKVQQALNEGKPAKIVERMVEGRIEKYYKEVCLLEQPFVKDPDISVKKMLAGKCDVVRFVRFERGEGLEKRQDNLAADIAAEQAKMKK